MSKAVAVLCLALLAGSLLTGCFEAQGLTLTPLSVGVAPFDGTYTFTEALAFDASGARLEASPLLDAAALPWAVEQMLPGGGAEPNIGITSSGAVFVTTGDQVQRSRDHGVTWEVVHDLVSFAYPATPDQFSSIDPMLWVDTTTDRVYVDHMQTFDPLGLAVFCTYMAWSDDEGDTWTARPYSCATPILDHQKVMTAPPGPKSPPLPMLVYSNVLYMCVNKLDIGTTCMVSLDGGYTYAYERPIHANTDPECANINGHPSAFPDGTVAVVLGNLGVDCERPLSVSVTEDSGLTWEVRQCDPEARQFEIDADITVTPDGTAYVAYRDLDQAEWLLRSKDKFVTCDRFRVAPPDHTLSAFSAITSGDDGRIAIAYLSTRDAQDLGAVPSNATAGSVWHAFITTSIDAQSENPTFVTQQVTPTEDPVQVGCVWQGGGAGGPYQCRNLLDFIDAVRDPEGRVHVAITDGCSPRNGCTGSPEQSDFQSRDSEIAVLVQDRGMSLFAEKGILPSLGLVAPRPLER